VSSVIAASLDIDAAAETRNWTLGDLKRFFMDEGEAAIKRVARGLGSEAIAGAVKLMSEAELVAVGGKIFNPPPGSSFGARGYLGSRIQPNSPTDDPEEVLFSVLEGLSYGCGDVVLGINPVASDWRNVARLERTLAQVIRAFELQDATTYCVLAHIDDQLMAQDLSEAAGDDAVRVDVGFQSIAGTATANRTFDLDHAKLRAHLSRLRRQYFETGQGSEFTNKCAEGIDMVWTRDRPGDSCLPPARTHGGRRAATRPPRRLPSAARSVARPFPELARTRPHARNR